MHVKQYIVLLIVLFESSFIFVFFYKKWSQIPASAVPYSGSRMLVAEKIMIVVLRKLEKTKCRHASEISSTARARFVDILFLHVCETIRISWRLFAHTSIRLIVNMHVYLTLRIYTDFHIPSLFAQSPSRPNPPESHELS